VAAVREAGLVELEALGRLVADKRGRGRPHRRRAQLGHAPDVDDRRFFSNSGPSAAHRPAATPSRSGRSHTSPSCLRRRSRPSPVGTSSPGADSAGADAQAGGRRASSSASSTTRRSPVSESRPDARMPSGKPARAGYRTVNGEIVTLVERWDGTQWRVDPSPNVPGGGNLYGLSVDPGGGLWGWVLLSARLHRLQAAHPAPVARLRSGGLSA
jgi:hypothetical protein